MAVAVFQTPEDIQPPPPPPHHLTRTTVLSASVAGIAIGGPLLSMMGLTLLASTITLLLSSPLLLIFSPVILSAGIVVATACVGFAAAAAMAFAGTRAFAWIFRSVCGGRTVAIDGAVTEKLTESGRRLKVAVYPPENMDNRS